MLNELLKKILSVASFILNHRGLFVSGYAFDHQCCVAIWSFIWVSKSWCFLLTLSCTMRVGKGIHPEGMPGWCQGFSLDGGSGVRALKVIQHGNRPGLIYNIGRCWWEHVRNTVELAKTRCQWHQKQNTYSKETYVVKGFWGSRENDEAKYSIQSIFMSLFLISWV